MLTQMKWSVLPVVLLMTFAMAESRALAAQGSSSPVNSSSNAASQTLESKEAAIPADTDEERSATGDKPTLIAITGVNKTIDDLSSAFAHRDLAEIKQVWPSIPQKPFTALEKSFGSFNSASRSFRPENIDFNGNTATVVGSYSGFFINKVTTISSSGRFHATLRKSGTRWIVVTLVCT